MAGSRWLSFGVTNASFYTNTLFSRALGPLVEAVLGGAQPLPALAALPVAPAWAEVLGEAEPARLPQLRLGPVANGTRDFVFTDPQSGAERRWSNGCGAKRKRVGGLAYYVNRTHVPCTAFFQRGHSVRAGLVKTCAHASSLPFCNDRQIQTTTPGS